MKFITVSFILAAGLAYAGESSLSRREALRAHAQLKSGLVQDRKRADELLETARNRSLADSERLPAIKELRQYALSHAKVFVFLRDSVLDHSETSPIRSRAAQSLGRVIGQPGSREYREALLVLRQAVEKDPSEEVKAMALKALHWATTPIPDRDNTRAWMLELAKSEKAQVSLRVAALWALGSSSQYDDVAPVLKSLAQDPDQPEAVRVQALKSFYLGNAISDRKAGIELAENGNESVDLRATAVLFLFASLHERDSKKALEGLAQDKEPRVRAAAALVLRNDWKDRQHVWYFFRVRYDHILHRAIEVLEYE